MEVNGDVRQIAADALNCPMCEEPYETEEPRTPVVLNCFHTFCRKCLEGWAIAPGARVQDGFSCPTCRSVCKRRVEELNINFALMTVIEGERTWTGQPQTPAMCQDCDGNMALARQKHICQKHMEQELRYYCNTCNTAVYMDCAIKDHRNHDFDLLQDVARKHGNYLCELADDMSPLQTTLEQAIRRIVVEEALLDLEAAEQRTTVKQHFAHLIQVLRAREQHLMSEIEEMQAHKHKLLACQREGLTSAVEIIASGCKFARDTAKLEDKVEMMAAYTNIGTQFSCFAW